MSKEKIASKRKPKNFLPLMSAFLVIILLMVMLFLGSSIVDSYWQQATEDASEITSERSKMLQTVIEKNINQMQAFLNFSNYAFAVADDQYTAYEEISDFSTELNSKKAYYFMTDSRIYSSNGQRVMSVNENITALLGNTGQVVSQPYYDSELGADVVAVYCSINDDSNEQVSAVVGIYLNSAIYADCLFNNETGNLTYFIDSTGNIVFEPIMTETAVQTENLSDLFSKYGIDTAKATEVISNLAAGKEDVYLLEGNSTKAIVGVSKVGTDYDWYAITMVTTEVIAERTQGIIDKITVLGVFVLLCFITLLLFYCFSDFKHLRKMSSVENFDQIAKCSNQSKFVSDTQKLLYKNPSVMYAIMYLDISNFNYIHSIYGFRIGDEMMSTLSRIILKKMKHNDTYGRLSDGRMVIMSAYKNKSELTDLFEEISNTFVESSEPLNSNRYHVKPMAGIYCIDRSQKHYISEMIDFAVFAKQSIVPESNVLYAYYSEKDRDKALSISNIEATMEQALKNKEFELYLQPKYNIQQKTIDGAEALVRWNRPGIGILNPDDFIPIFEKNGFISLLDKFIFNEVCKLLKKTIESGKRVIPISVNVSRSSAGRSDFLEYYISTKKKYGIIDDFLELEFTESIAMESYDVLGNTIKVLRENGFTCSMDDFGEGYSSFKALKTLPFNVIKLDKFFLLKSGNSQRDEYLLSGIISLAKMLDMKVIMEGVETEDEMKLLRRMKCDAIQGYYYAKPMPVKDFIIFVDKAFERPVKNRLQGNVLNKTEDN